MKTLQTIRNQNRPKIKYFRLRFIFSWFLKKLNYLSLHLLLNSILILYSKKILLYSFLAFSFLSNAHLSLSLSLSFFLSISFYLVALVPSLNFDVYQCKNGLHTGVQPHMPPPANRRQGGNFRLHDNIPQIYCIYTSE
jgi:hypothetical protein